MKFRQKRLFANQLLIIFLVLVAGFLCWPVSVKAVEDAETKRDLRAVNVEIQRGRKQSNRVRIRCNSVLKELDDLNRWHLALDQDLTELVSDKNAAKLLIQEQEIEACRLEKSLAKIRDKFCQRLKIRYCQPAGKWLDFLDSEADLTSNLNSLVYGRRVLAADKKLQASYLSLLAEVQARRLELEKRHKFLADLELQQADKMATLEENIAKKNELLYKIKHQVKAHKQLVKELEGVAAELKQMTRKTESSKSGFAELKGHLPMPVEGVVVSFFGIEKDARFATATRNKGIEIEAQSGAPVKVVCSGEVVYASWMKGYGNLLVVDHGKGYYSVYAHLDKFSCKVHDQLKSAAVVGGVGRGVFSDRASLYFEIRKGGVPEDPLMWIGRI